VNGEGRVMWMVLAIVGLKIATLGRPVSTEGTGVRFLPRVSSDVLAQIAHVHR